MKSKSERIEELLNHYLAISNQISEIDQKIVEGTGNVSALIARRKPLGEELLVIYSQYCDTQTEIMEND